jgi:hypothetical protein
MAWTRWLPAFPWEWATINSRWRFIRAGGWLLVILAPIALVAQFQSGTNRALKRIEKTPATQVSEQKPTKQHKGAIGRWRREILAYMQGTSIYGRETGSEGHPNMPATAVLLYPVVALPVPAMALVWNLAKLAAIAGMICMAARVATPGGMRLPDWIVLIGILCAIQFYSADIQHGNTNVFVACAVIAHVWLFRAGRDLSAGLCLALAICLKVTPGLFVLYWLTQRQWRVLGGVAIGMTALLAMPFAFLDAGYYVETSKAWVNTILLPGAAGAWYPTHINQSLHAMVARLFTGGQTGDATPESAWITLIDLGPAAARWILRVLQLALLLLSAWAIGFRRLARDDGRRALHYGLILTLMLLLNQRSWDHHAAYLLLATLAIVVATHFGLSGGTFRKCCAIALGVLVFIEQVMPGDLLDKTFGSHTADRIAAYGTTFWMFLGLWVLCLLHALKLKHLEPPYAPQTEATPATMAVAVQP